jgi:hypothetical protein
MSTTLAGSVSTGRSWTFSTRVALAAVAVIILLAAAFVIGRTTVGSQHVAAVPASTAAQTSAALCRFGRPC